MRKLSPETWLVSSGRPEEAGSPLNVPPVLASNFLIGAGREYSRDGATRTWSRHRVYRQ
jgi:cystathionine gamma-synthase